MSTIYDTIMWAFGAAPRNARAAHNANNQPAPPNNLAVVMYQNLIRNDVEPEDYYFTIFSLLFLIQFAIFIAAASIWAFRKISQFIRKKFKPAVKVDDTSVNAELMESIIKEGGIMSQQKSSTFLLMQTAPKLAPSAPPAPESPAKTITFKIEDNTSPPPKYREIEELKSRSERSASLEPKPTNYNNIPKPSILTRTTDVERWSSKMDAYIYGNNIDNKTAVLISFIDDDCLELLEEANTENQSYEEYKDTIKQIFKKEKRHKIDESEFYNRKQKEDEGYELYSLELARLAKKVFKDLKPEVRDEKVMIQFVNGIENQTVKHRIMTDSAEDMQGIIAKAKYYDKNLLKYQGDNSMMESPEQIKASASPSTSSRDYKRPNRYEQTNDRGCFICNSRLHIARECPDKDSQSQQNNNYGRNRPQNNYQGQDSQQRRVFFDNNNNNQSRPGSADPFQRSSTPPATNHNTTSSQNQTTGATVSPQQQSSIFSMGSNTMGKSNNL